ncbi:hypothetical protein C4546_01850 [Candidatus Parcubacteria bacterium]|jgi:nucleotidyltransferase/DNA polymerase involved in DNA repair|nr:MAG: hypothetical protein C4546_01850 [Candidatus Parcubacteria bacterium]
MSNQNLSLKTNQTGQNQMAHHFLVVSIWHFWASLAEALNPRLRNLPLALVENLNEQARIVDCNVLASNLGIRKNQSLNAALRKTPRLVVKTLSENHQVGFVKTFQKLAKKWGEPLKIQDHEVLLRIPATTVIQRAAKFLKVQTDCWLELECKIKAGFGSTPILAKLAMLTLKQPGFKYLSVSDQEHLKMIPLQLLPGLGWRTGAVLKRYGVNNVSDFLTTPADQVYAWLGKNGLRLQYQINRGFLTTPNPVENFQKNSDFKSRLNLKLNQLKNSLHPNWLSPNETF